LTIDVTSLSAFAHSFTEESASGM